MGSSDLTSSHSMFPDRRIDLLDEARFAFNTSEHLGTAGRLRSLKDYVIAAKSGTVELVSTETKEDYEIIRETEGKRDHAIIIAFAPMPNPKYAISVVIENGESGGSVAGPVAVAVLNSLVKND